MRFSLGILFVSVCGLAFAQPVETRVYRAILSPANENPPIGGLSASGTATLYVHAVKDASGAITSGSVDFVTNVIFPSAITVTGMHIHRGAAGANGPVTVDSGIRGTDNLLLDTGRGVLSRQGQAQNQAAIDTLNGIWSDPGQYYLNVHTTDNAGGAIRGQLVRAETITLVGLMSPANENPPVASSGSATGVVTANVTRDPAGRLTSGEVLFDVSYDFSEPVTFTGLHIHTGPRGTNGPVTLNSGMTGQTPSAANGRGRLQFRNEMNVANAGTAAALNGIFWNPAGYYINIHTSTFTGGIARDQLRPMDRMEFPVTLSPDNEVPAITGLNASAPSLVTIRTLRAEDGTVTMGYVTYDVNHRFPGDTEFTGLHVHNGASDASGPVRLDSGLSSTNSVHSDTGFGNINISFAVNDTNGLATLNSLAADPALHYLNLHTTVNRGGAVRAQLGTPRAGPPAIGAITSASDPAVTTSAGGGLISIYGANFANVPTDISGWQGNSVPTSLNGVKVTLDGVALPLLYASPAQINAQVPVGAATGTRQVMVDAGGGATSPAFNFTINPTAPSLFSYELGGIVVRNSDFTLIGPSNPARAGDILLVYSTGNGATSPALQTGVPAPLNPLATINGTTATIGGQSAQVIYSAASPGFLGLYQTAVMVPAGVTAGDAPLVLTVGGRASNAVTIAVR